MTQHVSERRNRRILVVDDNPAIHEDFRKILGITLDGSDQLRQAAAELFDEDLQDQSSFSGFEIDSAFQGREGYDLVKKATREGRPYALAFVDVRMPPGWDGLETVARLWQADPEVLVVLCTAYSDYSWEEVVDSLGRTDRFLILKKPFDNVEVRQLAMALVEKWHLARTDSLTGLLNRRAFYENFHREWARCTRHAVPLSCVMLDLDFFKRINDTYGHVVGDQVLQQIGELVNQKSRAGDYVCRYGGEEICALLPDTDEQGALSWADRIGGAILDAQFPAADDVLRVTASFGVAQRGGDANSPEFLVEQADQALIVAKQLGRNRTVLHSTFSDPARPDCAGNGPPRRPFHNQQAGDAMSGPVESISQWAPIAEAARVLLEQGVNAAPVVDGRGQLVGLVSEKDLMGVMESDDSWRLPVEQVMQRNVICYQKSASLHSIYAFLCRVTIHRVVIVENHRPVGVLSRADLLRHYLAWVASREPSADEPTTPYAESDAAEQLPAIPLAHDPETAADAV